MVVPRRSDRKRRVHGGGDTLIPSIVPGEVGPWEPACSSSQVNCEEWVVPSISSTLEPRWNLLTFTSKEKELFAWIAFHQHTRVSQCAVILTDLGETPVFMFIEIKKEKIKQNSFLHIKRAVPYSSYGGPLCVDAGIFRQHIPTRRASTGWEKAWECIS